jgi:hypothetical protein
VSTAHADSLGLVLRPATSLVTTGQIVEVRMLVRRELTGPYVAPQAQSFLALDVILEWDPAKLRFLGLTSTGSIPMLFSYLPSPAQDYTGLNELNPPRDGDLFYTGATPLGQPRNVSESDAQVTSFRFQVLGSWSSTQVRVVPSKTVATYAETVVYDGTVPGLGVTGPFTPAQLRQCVADLDRNGTVDGADLALLLAAFGQASATADLDQSGTVEGADLGLLLAAWGPCQ